MKTIFQSKHIHFLLGALLAVLSYFLIATNSEASPQIAKMIGVAVFMIYLWLTEPISMQVTALFPIILLPAFDLLPLAEATAPYAHPVIFLFLGGFIMAKGLEKWNIHRRIALWMLARFGNSPANIIGAMMGATTLISMCISNTATTIMMLPIGLSIIQIIQREIKNDTAFPVGMLISIAYAANVGGEGTIIGSPPNAILVGLLNDELGIEIGFFEWMLVGVPLVVILMIPAFLLITKVFYKMPPLNTEAIKHHFAEELRVMGPLSPAERRIVFLLGLAMFLWVFKANINGLLGAAILSDTGIALLCGIIMLALPSGLKDGKALLPWAEGQQIAWGILLFFGGALSLAKALSETTAINFITDHALNFPPSFSGYLVVGICITTMLFLTEFMGGTALSSIFVPIMFGVAAKFGIPVLELCFTVVFASNCSFMLPMATPPNAIVFSTSQLKVSQMVRIGWIMNIIAIGIIWLIGVQLVSWVF